jgi:hypothetical protein
MRRLAVLLLLVAGPLLLLARRRRERLERISLYFGDGSTVTLERGAPGSERLLELARRAL